MYKVLPSGINIKDSDRNVADNFLLESLNLQYRDGSLMPIPDRLVSTIDVTGYDRTILHKVSDENQINVLCFKTGTLALYWIGQIDDGVYTAKGTHVLIPDIVYTENTYWTILNGLIYFMGDGTTSFDRFYYQLQYNQDDDAYSVKDMYAWKDISFKLILENSLESKVPDTYANLVVSICGMILVRYAFVLKTGETVLHSSVFPYEMMGVNFDASVAKGDLITNIHTYIPFNQSIINSSLYPDEISEMNIYATVADYETTVGAFVLDGNGYAANVPYDAERMLGYINAKASGPYYYVGTISEFNVDKGILLYVDSIDSDLDFSGGQVVSRIKVETIPAGEVMPVDDFSHHWIYGKIGSWNGRLEVKSPSTVLSPGFAEQFTLRNATLTANYVGMYYEGYDILTEDGKVMGGVKTSKGQYTHYDFVNNQLLSECILGYPDYRGTKLLLGTYTAQVTENTLSAFNSLNLSLDLTDVQYLQQGGYSYTKSGGYFNLDSFYKGILVYDTDLTTRDQDINLKKYTSQNRVQFSEQGEFSVWPVERSYRIGEGKVLSVGDNYVNPANSETIGALMVGTTDGIYTMNLDPTGVVFIASITKARNIPFLSEETLNIDGALIFVSDKGLMVMNDGDPINLTAPFFPENGNGNFPTNETIYPNYNLLTTDIFGGSGNIYSLDDIVTYMKGAIFAYDGRRENIWCSNDSYNFSMVFNTARKTWTFSTLVFSEKIELFSLINTVGGDIFSRYLVRGTGNNLLILSGEDDNTEVNYHLMTRPLKMGAEDNYKKIIRMFSRCELSRSGSTGYFYFGGWGKQDLNKSKVNIPLMAFKTNSTDSYPDNVRQDIGVGVRKGKYKSITLMQGGRTMPDSKIDGFEINAQLVENNKLR